MSKHFRFLISLIAIVISSTKGDDELLPPEMMVRSQSVESAEIYWKQEKGSSYTGFWLKISSPNFDELRVMNIDPEQNSLTIRNLTPNTTYNLELYTMLHDRRSVNSSSASLTTFPLEPQEIFASEITENSFLIQYNKSFRFNNFHNRKYEFLIVGDNKDTPEITSDSYKLFNDLTPNTYYYVSVRTFKSLPAVEKDKPRRNVVKSFKTLPPTPLQDSKHLPHFETPTTLRVKWMPPNTNSTFDGYRVIIYWHDHDDGPHEIQKVILPSHVHHHDFQFLSFGHKFTAEIRTFGGKDFSKPLILQNRESLEDQSNIIS